MFVPQNRQSKWVDLLIFVLPWWNRWLLQLRIAGTKNVDRWNESKVEKIVGMSGAPILLDTRTARTDAAASIRFVGSTFTTMKFQVRNGSASRSTLGLFRLVSGRSSGGGGTGKPAVEPVSSEISVGPGKTGFLVAFDLRMGTSYSTYLERKELGAWIRQGEKGIVRATHDMKDLSVSTSSSAAVVSWTRTHGGAYSVYLDERGKKTLVPEVAPKFNPKTNKFSAVFSGLTSGAQYAARVAFVEATRTGSSKKVIAQHRFAPSAFANLEVISTFATFASLSWDSGGVGKHEADKEADFKVVKLDVAAKKESVAVDWTPDTTGRKAVVKGLRPGARYAFRLYRRGVDGRAVFQEGSEKTTTTKATRATATWTGSTALAFNWDEIYDKASYGVRFGPAGSDGAIRRVTGTGFVPRGLEADTEFQLDLFVREQGKNHLVSTVRARTDRPGALALLRARHTTVSLETRWFAPNSSNVFHVVSEDGSVKSERFRVAGTGKRTVEIRGLKPGSTHRFSLHRIEYGKFEKQRFGADSKGDLSVTTKALVPSVSVASTSAMLQWEQGYAGAAYEVQIFSSSSSSSPVQTKADGDIAATKGGRRAAVVAGLDMETEYRGTISALEEDATGVASKLPVGSVVFDTSAGAVFRVGEVRASDATLSWSAGEVEEADGVAEFLVTRVEAGGKKEADASTWLPHRTGGSSAATTVGGLKPGTAYAFRLYRKSLDGSRALQAVVGVTTKSSSLTVTGTASSRLEVEWSTLYAGARYVLTYAPKGGGGGGGGGDGSPATFGGGPVTVTRAVISGLESNQEYTLELFVLENGRRVGVSTAALGSAVTVKTDRDFVLLGGVAAAVVALVIALVVAMKNKNK